MKQKKGTSSNENPIKIPPPKARINEITSSGVVKLTFSNEMYVPSSVSETSDTETKNTRKLKADADPL